MQGAFEHVCMFENLLPVIENETYTLTHTRSSFIEKPNTTSLKRLFVIYVCLETLCLSWKMKHTDSNMHPQKPSKIMKKIDSGSVRACMYLWKPSACHRKWNIHAQHTRSISIQKPNKTQLKRLFIMYVCLKTLCLSWKTKHTRSNMNLRTQLKL